MFREPRELFGGRGLPDEAKSRTEEALGKVDRADVNELLSRDLEVLVEEVLESFERVTVHWEKVTMTEPTPTTQQIADGFGGTVNLSMAVITCRVPVDGDPLLLTYHSYSGAPIGGLPGKATPDRLELWWTGALDADTEGIRQWFAQRRNAIEPFLANNNRDVDSLNQHMREQVRRRIVQRREAELARRNLAARLPFPVERRPGATRRVTVRRKQVHVERRTPTPQFAPEPALGDPQFDEIIADCVAMATVFERTPSVEALGEEALRNLVLGMLNTNYTGDVAGEVFNGKGKTDICIRVEDRNVFIGECKFYDGPKTVTAAVDQLLGYLVWRDTKAALLLFVRGGNFTQAVDRARDAVASHTRCQWAAPAADPTRRSDYVFSRGDDPDRAIHLAVLPFHLHPGTAGDPR